MKDKTFIDTNVLVYAHDLDAEEKHQKAVEIISNLWEEKNGVISTQVLQEFYVNVTRKIPRPQARSKAREIVRNYGLWQTEIIESADVVQASELEETHRVSFRDALIIVSVAKGGAATLLSEDLNAGQKIAGVVIHNPFA